jgi:hypothetical protein
MKRKAGLHGYRSGFAIQAHPPALLNSGALRNSFRYMLCTEGQIEKALSTILSTEHAEALLQGKKNSAPDICGSPLFLNVNSAGG